MCVYMCMCKYVCVFLHGHRCAQVGVHKRLEVNLRGHTSRASRPVFQVGSLTGWSSAAQAGCLANHWETTVSSTLAWEL